MTKEQIQNQVADNLSGAADDTNPTPNQASKPPEPPTSEAAQEAYQAMVTAYSTKLIDGIAHSEAESQDAKKE